ncbi:MAG: discoidin domain-containing protein [Bacteroidaceae bacterium]|nr:discoidin domain-containing protein [Bacteroidaceae bacterium]
MKHNLLLALALCSCAGQVQQNRGIGIYPGNPDEDFSPVMVAGGNELRNLALNRKAYASSAIDYNLTAQLATDGIVSTGTPASMRLFTNQGEVPALDRELLFDFKTTKYSASGENPFFLMQTEGYSLQFNHVYIVGTVRARSQAWKISLLASTDGASWTNLGNSVGKGQNCETDIIVKADTEAYSQFKLALETEGDATWTLSNWNFAIENAEQMAQKVGGQHQETEQRYPTAQAMQVLQNVTPESRFCSAWVSNTGAKEWFYVDLGIESSVEKVILQWINPAQSGKVQASTDGRKWNDVASLDGNEIAFESPVNARYVKLLLDNATGSKPYMLSEIQVLGKGGLSVEPKPMPAATESEMLLSGGNWKLQNQNVVSAQGQQISANGFDDSGWICATVPGSVLSSYINIGAVPDPNYSDNQLQISDSFFNSNFWYRNQFTVPADFGKEKLFLDFDGINWKAIVWMNGQQVGRIDGAFTRARFDVTKLVRKGQENTVAVQIISNANPGAIKEQTQATAQSNGGILGGDNPTFHASIGWDWIPTIRGRNNGIWNDVRLTTTGAVTLADAYVKTTLNLPDTTKAQVSISIDATNRSNSEVSGVLNGKYGDISFSRQVTLAAGETKTLEFSPANTPALAIENPRLWWPRGYGEPYLHDVSIDFSIDGKMSDSKAFKSGIRQMTYNEDNGILSLFVNGRRFIGRGGNWGFSESNLNYRAREYDAAVRYHADMNFTMIRNWVGQIGDDEFFEACDRHGIMIWQDFWLANPWDGPDPYDEEMFMQNAIDFVKRIHNHPSIALYVGRNEGNPVPELDTSLRALTQNLGGGVHYISHSSRGVVSGEGPYRALNPSEYFTLPTGQDKLHSERGMPNVMNFESLVRAFPEEDLWPQNRMWGIHDFTQGSAQTCTTFNGLVEKAFGTQAKDAEQFTQWAQLINYNGYRAMFEARSLNRRGLLLWMSHPAWPSMVWQTYDYYLAPTAAYFGCKKASEPLHIQWNQGKDCIEVVNLSAGSHQALEAKVQVVTTDGKVVWERSETIDSNEDTTVKCFDMQYPAGISPTHFISLTLKDAKGKLLSDNFYVRGVNEGNYSGLLTMEKANVTCKEKFSQKGSECTVTATVKNHSSVPAFMIRLDLKGSDGEQILPVLYSDNYISLLPGQEKTITIRYSEADARGTKPHIELSSL